MTPRNMNERSKNGKKKKLRKERKTIKQKEPKTITN